MMSLYQNRILFVITILFCCFNISLDGMYDYEYESTINHYNQHIKQIDSIEASSQPLTTASAITPCVLCMERAIALHPHSGIFLWLFSCCRKKLDKDDDARTAIWYTAAHPENIGQFILLTHYFDVGLNWTKYGRPLLIQAVEHMNLEAARALLQRGDNVDQRVIGPGLYMDYTPLMIAVHTPLAKEVTKRIDMVKLLLKYGADVNVWDIPSNDPPLHLTRDKEVASILIDHGAYIDGINDGGSIFEAPFVQQSYLNDPELNSILKKIVIEGSFMSHKIIFLRPTSFRSAIEWEFLLQQIITQFNQAGIPRSVQVLILNYVSKRRKMNSVYVLSHIGDFITPQYADFVIGQVSARVLSRVANKLEGDKKSIFVKRLVNAYTHRRLESLAMLMDKKMKNGTLGEFICTVIPEYRPIPTLPAPQLEADIRMHYLKKLLGNTNEQIE